MTHHKKNNFLFKAAFVQVSLFLSNMCGEIFKEWYYYCGGPAVSAILACTDFCFKAFYWVSTSTAVGSLDWPVVSAILACTDFCVKAFYWVSTTTAVGSLDWPVVYAILACTDFRVEAFYWVSTTTIVGSLDWPAVSAILACTDSCVEALFWVSIITAVSSLDWPAVSAILACTDFCVEALLWVSIITAVSSVAWSSSGAGVHDDGWSHAAGYDDTMTSLHHDDSIEVISVQADSALAGDSSDFVDMATITPTSAEDKFRVVPPHQDPISKKQKRIKSAVMVVGGGLIIMSLVLVGVTLSLSDHIDEMGKLNKMNFIANSCSTQDTNGDGRLNIRSTYVKL